MEKWLSYEHKVYNYFLNLYQKDFHPNQFEIKHKIYIRGQFSNALREIDVFIMEKIIYSERRIAIECKYHKAKVDVKELEAFKSKLEDINILNGYFFSNSGFTKHAMDYAKSKNIILHNYPYGELYNFISDESPLDMICPGGINTFFGDNHHLVSYTNYYIAEFLTTKYYVYYGLCMECMNYIFYCTKCKRKTMVPYSPYENKTTLGRCRCNLNFQINNKYSVITEYDEINGCDIPVNGYVDPEILIYFNPTTE